MPGLTAEKAHELLSKVGISHQPGVYHSKSWGIRFDDSILDALEAIAKKCKNGKARLCLHPTSQDQEQQMLVALTKDCVDQVHFHPDKGETVLWVRGEAEHRTLDMSGKIQRVTPVGQSDFRYLHTPAGTPHHFVILSDTFMFWEFAKGPYGPTSTVPIHDFDEKAGVE